MYLRKDIEDKIATYGHMLVGVGAEANSPPFIYTIGLTGRFGFELLVVGLPMQYAGIVNDIATCEMFHDLDVPNEEFTNLPLMFKRCTRDLDLLHDEFVVQADQFYGKKIDVVQIVMCDRFGNFPGSSEYDHAYMDPRQPIFYKP